MSGLSFDELSLAAQTAAIDHCRHWNVEDDGWSECVTDDFVEIADALGFFVRKHSVAWSGFWTQGSGASFRGDFASCGRAGARIRDHAPNDKALHELADQLDLLHFEVQLTHGATVYARIARMGRDVHSGAMSVENCGLIAGRDELEIPDALADEIDSRVLRVARELADWFYDQLQEEYEWQTSDDTIGGLLQGSGYKFSESGRMI